MLDLSALLFDYGFYFLAFFSAFVVVVVSVDVVMVDGLQRGFAARRARHPSILKRVRQRTATSTVVAARRRQQRQARSRQQQLEPRQAQQHNQQRQQPRPRRWLQPQAAPVVGQSVGTS